MTSSFGITPATWITISRILLVPVFTYLYLKARYNSAVVVFALAGFTDALDGWMARRFKMRSRIGSFLDPSADKILMLAGLLLLSFDGYLPWSFTWLIIGRDIGISAGVILFNLMKIHLYYKPTVVSKMATVSQIAVIILSFLKVLTDHEPPNIFIELVRPLTSILHPFFLYAAAGFTIVSAFQYIYLGYKFYRFGERLSQK